MIVKNEQPILRQCLESVKPYIDCWVIVDTGSTDGTQELIREVMQGIPGELHERSWVDFAYNRNEALTFAKTKATHALFIDADEQLVSQQPFPSLDKQEYFISVREPTADYLRIFLIDLSLPWQWQGAVHETLVCAEAKTGSVLSGMHLFSDSSRGARSRDPDKYLKDAALLEKALERNPTDSRSVFYLAQSYLNAGKLDQALDHYQKRSCMGGWDQEVFWSLYQVGVILEMQQASFTDVVRAYTTAYGYRPSRAEPLYRLARYFLLQHEPFLAYTTAKQGLALPIPSDNVFVEQWIYRFGLLHVLADAALQLGLLDEFSAACKTLLAQDDLPSELRAIILSAATNAAPTMDRGGPAKGG